MDTLKHHESFISKQCLKSDSCSNYIDKQTEFVETCRSVHPNPSAIYTIIQDKLFRIKYQSVENYFRYPRPNSSLRWDVSRAQAYRFMDCHPVLNILASCTAVPHRIRLCQALKKSVGSLDPTRMHSTWSTVVKECEGVEEAIAGFDWSSLTPSQPAVLASDEDSEATVGTGRRKRHGGGGKKRVQGLRIQTQGFSTEIELAFILTKLSADGRSSWRLDDEKSEDQDQKIAPAQPPMFIC